MISNSLITCEHKIIYLDAGATDFLAIIFPPIFPPNDTREAVGGPASDCRGNFRGKPSAAFDVLEGPIEGLDNCPALLFAVD
jgi:hypothetical protein